MKSVLQHRVRYDQTEKTNTKPSKRLLAAFIAVIIAALIVLFNVADSLFPVV